MTSESAKHRILVVEDETLIALEIEDALEALGCEVVGPVSTLQRALELAQRGALDGAILDVTVRGGKTYAVAELLLARGIPFLFASGQSDWTFPPEMRLCPSLAKPFTAVELREHLQSLVTEIGLRNGLTESEAIAPSPDQTP
jgi:CheY-like chemotaxis protein